MKKHLNRIMLTLGGLLVLGSHSSADTLVSDMYTCIEKSKTTPQMAQCALKHHNQAQGIHKNMLKAALDLQSPAKQKELLAAENKWKAYQTAYCDRFLTSHLSGSNKTYLKFQCLTETTVAHDQNLNHLLVSP